MTVILGARLSNRLGTSVEVQNVLTEYGCEIKTRLGLHDISENECKNSGLILLEITNDEKASEIESRLKKISGIEVQNMKF